LLTPLRTKLHVSIYPQSHGAHSSGILTKSVQCPGKYSQMSGPDLHEFTFKFLALKNWFFPHKKYFPKFFWLLFTFILCNFSVPTLKYFQKKFKLFFCPGNFKIRASKVAHNRPRPFYFTVQPRPQPTAHNQFFILWNLGTRHLFSYLWVNYGYLEIDSCCQLLLCNICHSFRSLWDWVRLFSLVI
jgi:hypothetical protein